MEADNPLPTSNNKDRTLHNILEAVALALSVWFVWCFAYVVFYSIRYPFNLEWLEGGIVDVVQRVLEGRGVYTYPTPEYVPFIYTPIYYYVSAFMGIFTGGGFLPARLVSVYAVWGIACLMYVWIRREGGSAIVAIIGVGLFLSTYEISARWFDLARVDSLFLFLTFFSMYVFMYMRKTTQHALYAAVLFACAFFTKQTALTIFAPLLLVELLFLNRLHALKTCVFLGVILWVSIAIADYKTQGWFSYFVFDVPRGHYINRDVLNRFLGGRSFYGVVPMLVLSLMLLRHLYNTDRQKLLRYAAILLGCLATSLASRMHTWGWINTLIPLHLAMALLSAMMLSKVEIFSAGRDRFVPGILIVAQMIYLCYDPNRFIPHIEEKRNWAFVEALKQYKGDIFAADIQYIPRYAGKTSHTFGMAAKDLVRTRLPIHAKDREYAQKKLLGKVLLKIRRKEYAAIIPGRLIFRNLPELTEHYKLDRKIRYSEGVSWPSRRKRWVEIYVPK